MGRDMNTGMRKHHLGMVDSCNTTTMTNSPSIGSFLYLKQQAHLLSSNFHSNLSSNSFNPIVSNIPSPYLHSFACNKKEEQNLLAKSSCSSMNTSPAISPADSSRTARIRRGKGGKGADTGTANLKEAIHVRAKRGQATDSHSIAERVRRQKINQKFKCLQELVPGCNKSMGMAVKLEEIINYVYSLQNQVEFLSMQLATASRSYDPNYEGGSFKNLQKISSWETQEMQKQWYGDLGFGHATRSI